MILSTEDMSSMQTLTQHDFMPFDPVCHAWHYFLIISYYFKRFLRMMHCRCFAINVIYLSISDFIFEEYLVFSDFLFRSFIFISFYLQHSGQQAYRRNYFWFYSPRAWNLPNQQRRPNTHHQHVCQCHTGLQTKISKGTLMKSTSSSNMCTNTPLSTIWVTDPVCSCKYDTYMKWKFHKLIFYWHRKGSNNHTHMHMWTPFHLVCLVHLSSWSGQWTVESTWYSIHRCGAHQCARRMGVSWISKIMSTTREAVDSQCDCASWDLLLFPADLFGFDCRRWWVCCHSWTRRAPTPRTPSPGRASTALRSRWSRVTTIWLPSRWASCWTWARTCARLTACLSSMRYAHGVTWSGHVLCGRELEGGGVWMISSDKLSLNEFNWMHPSMCHLFSQDNKKPLKLAKNYGDMMLSTDTFSQVYPEHKYLIVECLRELGYKVGFLSKTWSCFDWIWLFRIVAMFDNSHTSNNWIIWSSISPLFFNIFKTESRFVCAMVDVLIDMFDDQTWFCL